MKGIVQNEAPAIHHLRSQKQKMALATAAMALVVYRKTTGLGWG